MKKFVAVILSFIMAASAFTSYAEVTHTIVNGKYVNESSQETDKAVQKSADASQEKAASSQTAAAFDVNRVNVPENAEVLVVLEGGKSESTGKLTLYNRAVPENGKSEWKEAFSTAAMYGKNGLYKEKEGDSRTPVGVFKMNTPFGIKEAQEGFPDNYIRVDNRYYWDGDSASSKYNRLVKTDEYTDFRTSESEHIIKYGGYYNYCIDTGYNPDCTPYKGSAIYLHCAVNGENTHGCIAIPEEDMIKVMKAYREGKTYIAIYDRENVSQVY